MGVTWSTSVAMAPHEHRGWSWRMRLRAMRHRLLLYTCLLLWVVRSYVVLWSWHLPR